MKTLRQVIIPVLMAITSAASAMDYRSLLEEKQVETLPPEALEIYRQAEYWNDRIALDEVVYLLAKAAEEAPNHAELQFLTLARARNRAEAYYSAAKYTPPPEGMEEYSSPPWKVSEPFYEIADTSIRNLSGIATLNSEQRRRLEYASKQVAEGKETMAARDDKRFADFQTVVDDVREQRRAYLDKKQGVDPLDPYQVYANGIRTDEPEEDAVQSGESAAPDPFLPLTGEAPKEFLPPPPANPGGVPGQFGGQFGGQLGGQLAGDFGGDPDVIQSTPGYIAAPADPFGGGK